MARHATGIRRGHWTARVLALVSLIALLLTNATTESARAQGRPVPPTSASSSPGAIPASRLANNLVIITIEGPIDAVTSKSVERRLERAVEGGADAVVFEIDSPGGEVGAVLEISSMIKACPIQNTTAWIHPTAYSGGAIIALACRRIVVSPGATMGDAAPIAANPLTGLMNLPETERMKILSPLIADVVDSARRNGYDELLVQTFVSLGIELWLIRDKRTGEQYFVTEEEYRAIFSAAPPRGTPHIASGGAVARSSGQGMPAGKPASSGTGGSPVVVPGMSDQQIGQIEETIRTESSRPVFASPLPNRYELVHYATDGNVLLTLKEQELKDYGFADPNVSPRSDADIERYLGAKNVRRLSMSWSEKMVRFMTQGLSGLVVRGLLIVIFLMAMFIEMTIPGVGIPGIVALAALAGLVVPPLLIGASSWWAGASVIAGIGLILIEIFVAPGFGLPGLLGLLFLFGGLVGTFAQSGELFPGTGANGTSDLVWAASIVLLAVFVAGVGMYFFTKMTNRFPIMGKLVLADDRPPEGAESGLLGAMAPMPADRSVEIGAIGRTITPLRPSGQAAFGENLVDVVAEYGFVERDRPIRAISVSAFRVGVEETEQADRSEATRNDAGADEEASA